MTYDPFRFVFDKSIKDDINDIRTDITVVHADTVGVMFTIRSGGLELRYFMEPRHARSLGQCILLACDAYDKAVASAKSAETASE